MWSQLFCPEVIWDNTGRQLAGLCAQIYRKAAESADGMLEPILQPGTICPGQKIAFTRLNSFPIIGHAFACAGDFFIQRGRII